MQKNMNRRIGLESKKIVLITRYSGKVDQDFMDLEFARLDQEREMEIEWEREELTRLILTGKGEYY